MISQNTQLHSSRLQNWEVFYRNSEEYHQLKQEVFTQDTYYFETEDVTPLIIDAGAHIGLSTLYFKQLYPLAQIIAIEPLPQNLEILECNVSQNRLEDISIISAALGTTTGTQDFFFDVTKDQWFSTASLVPGGWTGNQQTTHLPVKMITLSSLLRDIDRPIDLLKLDIEGAEQQVLSEAYSYLGQVKHIFVEYHPHPQQSLSKITELLSLHFNIDFWQNGKAVNPKKARGLVLIEGEK